MNAVTTTDGGRSRAEQSGLLLLRVWLEPAAEPGSAFRARITHRLDLTDEGTEMAVLTETEAVVSLIQAWLASFVGER